MSWRKGHVHHLPPEALRLISYCPFCNAHFSPFEANVVDEYGNTHLLHIICRRCSSSILIVVLTGELGISSVGLITDLLIEEIVRFKEQDAILTDDVIEVHQLLKKHYQF